MTRVISVDLPQGDTTLIARDFPPGLDTASLRVEGETAARVTIGAIDARAPRPERPPTAPELEKRLQALKDERATLDDRIGAEAARKQFAERFAAQTPFGLGEKGEARPLAEWRAAFGVVADEIKSANEAIRAFRLKQRDLDLEIRQVEAALQANPPRKMEVRIDLAANAASRATFRVSYTVRGARWAPLYDARLDSGTRERKPALELVRRAEIVQQTGEDWTRCRALGLDRAHRQGRQRPGAAAADRALPAAAVADAAKTSRLAAGSAGRARGTRRRQPCAGHPEATT